MFNFIKIALVSFLILGTCISAGSDITTLGNAYYFYYYQPAANILGSLPNRCAGCAAEQPNEIPENYLCNQFYDRISADGVIRMHVSFGYFDDSEGAEFIYDGINYGYNASTEQAWFTVLEKALTQTCVGNMQLCEFQEAQGGKFTKVAKLNNGKKVIVEINSEYPSVTPYYLVNTGVQAPEQKNRSSVSRQAFIDALLKDDAVFYIGHSRNGGGPDFYPPVLLSNGHVDYAGFYQIQTPGLNDLLTTVKKRKEAPPLLGMMSCLSEAWFGKKLVDLSPDSGYIFTQSNKLVGLNEHFMAAMAAMDGILRSQCAQGMIEQVKAVRTSDDIDEHVRNLMTKSSPVDVNAKPNVLPD